MLHHAWQACVPDDGLFLGESGHGSLAISQTSPSKMEFGEGGDGNHFDLPHFWGRGLQSNT